jgi:uncharacterized protein YndB with AHSA1/START domain
MTAADRSAPSQGTPSGDALALEFDLRHPPEKVWRALTDPVLLAEWLLPVTGFEPVPGVAFTFQTQAYPGWDGIVECRMLVVEPGLTLRYTWSVPFLETVVTFTLAPTASGTRLSIVQSGFRPDQKREFGGARYGWTMMGGKLTDLLARMT